MINKVLINYLLKHFISYWKIWILDQAQKKYKKLCLSIKSKTNWKLWALFIKLKNSQSFLERFAWMWWNAIQCLSKIFSSTFLSIKNFQNGQFIKSNHSFLILISIQQKMKYIFCTKLSLKKEMKYTQMILPSSLEFALILQNNKLFNIINQFYQTLKMLSKNTKLINLLYWTELTVSLSLNKTLLINTINNKQVIIKRMINHTVLSLVQTTYLVKTISLVQTTYLVKITNLVKITSLVQTINLKDFPWRKLRLNL